MKCNAKKLCLLIMMSTAAGLWTRERGWAQEPTPEPRTNPLGKTTPSVQPAQIVQQPAVRQSSPFAIDPFYGGPRKSVSRAGSDAIRKAAEAVRDAKNDDTKAAAQKKLTDLFSKFYDEDMAKRELELKQIDERLTKLRELLSRRRAKKQDIIDLQIKVALNDADGLGFYDNEGPPKGSANLYFYAPEPPGPRPVDSVPRTPSVSSLNVIPRANVPTKTSGGESFVDPAPSSDAEPSSSSPPR